MHRQEPALGLDPRGKAHAPHEFGVKVSIATTLHRSRGGQFALHAMALPGNPYDGHTLATVIPDMEKAIGNGITSILAILAAAGFNFRLLLNWLRLLLCLIVSAILSRSQAAVRLQTA